MSLSSVAKLCSLKAKTRFNCFALVAPGNDQLVCGFCNDCTMDAHEDDDGRQVAGLAVHICEGCQEGYHSHCIRDGLNAAATSPDHLSSVSWSDPSLVERHSTWRCGDCVKENRWGVKRLVESMLTFNTAQMLGAVCYLLCAHPLPC